MLEQLIKLTSSEAYLQNGGMKIKEMLIRPWQKEEAKLIIEIYIDDWQSDRPESQIWELTCEDIMYNTSSRAHEAKPPGTQIKVFNDHPILWNYGTSTYFSVKGNCSNIAELMGELFIAHQRLCGGWVDFQDLYSSLPETLETQRENQLSIPNQLLSSCFSLLKKYGVEHVINAVEEGEKNLNVLFFSKSNIWPDEVCFNQPHLVAKSFSEKRIDGR